MEFQTYYLTSGQRLQRWHVLKEGLNRLALFGPRGGWVGLLLYCDEDLKKIINVLSLAEPEQVQGDGPE